MDTSIGLLKSLDFRLSLKLEFAMFSHISILKKFQKFTSKCRIKISGQSFFFSGYFYGNFIDFSQQTCYNLLKYGVPAERYIAR